MSKDADVQHQKFTKTMQNAGLVHLVKCLQLLLQDV